MNVLERARRENRSSRNWHFSFAVSLLADLKLGIGAYFEGIGIDEKGGMNQHVYNLPLLSPFFWKLLCVWMHALSIFRSCPPLTLVIWCCSFGVVLDMLWNHRHLCHYFVSDKLYCSPWSSRFAFPSLQEQTGTSCFCSMETLFLMLLNYYADDIQVFICWIRCF